MSSFYAILESDSEFKASKERQGQRKIMPGKGKLEVKKLQDTISEPPGKEEGFSFREGPSLVFVAMVNGLVKADALTASPELKPERRKRLAFLAHAVACPYCLCSDLTLLALPVPAPLLHSWLAVSMAKGLGLIQGRSHFGSPMGCLPSSFSLLLWARWDMRLHKPRERSWPKENQCRSLRSC